MEAAFEKQLAELKAQVETLSQNQPENKISMVVFSGDLDKVLASFIIGTGAVAMGMEVVMFFTFWGTPLLRDKMKKVGGKDLMGTMFGSMLPKGTGEVKLVQDEHGRHGHGHDEVPDEKEKRGVSGADDRNGRGIGRTDLCLRNVHGSYGLQAGRDDRLPEHDVLRRGQIS